MTAAPTTESGTESAGAWVPHALHDDSRTWPEVNCYVDLWVELLHSRGLDPLLGAGFVFEGDFDGRQWTFHKYDHEDLLRVYGIGVAEINVWLPLAETVRDDLAAGRLLTVEVDAFHLPDTFGISYQAQHVKTTIAVDRFEPAGPAVGYFHGRGRYDVVGADADALLRLDGPRPDPFPPYVERVSFGPVADVRTAVLERARVHLARRAAGNPVERLAARMVADLDWLAEATAADERVLHDYAFATVRQCGAGAELAADVVATLGRLEGGEAPGAAEAFTRVATTAKSLQFILMRRAHGRRGDIAAPLAAMSDDWAQAVEAVVRHHG